MFDRLEFHKECSAEAMFKLLHNDLQEIMAYVFPSNSGELLRWTVASICINFLRPYLSDPVAKLDHVVEDLAFDADSAMADVGKLPAKISQWKLSTQEIGKWVKWSEEPNIGSSLEKEMSLSDIFITLTDLDLLMTVFMRRFLTTEDHFIVAGPTYCGKTATMKKWVKHLKSLAEGHNIVWFNCTDRFDLDVMQKKLTNITLIIDQFHFNESITSLLELYNDQGMLIRDGLPIESCPRIRVILVMDISELRQCQTYGIFSSNFQVVLLSPPTEDGLKGIVEQIMTWHLQIKYP
ncbi:Protein DHC-4 [Aphelenchoides avenae]|nr:Protein DHC-4 [Aphelenchus avenae]